MYLQQITLTQRSGHELPNHVFGDVWHERLLAKHRSFPVALWRLLVDSHVCEADNVTASAFSNVRNAHLCVDEVFRALVFGTMMFHEKHLDVGMCLKFSLCRRKMAKQAFLDCGWYIPSIQQGKCTTTLETGHPQLETRPRDRLLPSSTQRTSNYSGVLREGMPLLAVPKNLRLAIPRLWQMRCERKYKTSHHQNTFGSDLQVHSCGSNVWTASLRQRSEAAHSQETQWQAVGFCCTSTQNLMPSNNATPELQMNATVPSVNPNAPETLDVGT